MNKSATTTEIITAPQFDTEQKRYGVLIYIGLPFLPLVLTGAFVAIKDGSILEAIFWTSVAAMWIRTMLQSAKNVSTLRRARRDGLYQVAITPMIPVSRFDGKIFDNRDMRAMLIFVSFLYLLVIAAIIVNLLGLA
jgi:hypothetical protein